VGWTRPSAWRRGVQQRHTLSGIGSFRCQVAVEAGQRTSSRIEARHHSRCCVGKQCRFKSYLPIRVPAARARRSTESAVCLTVYWTSSATA
jgi:hypothetical protein